MTLVLHSDQLDGRRDMDLRLLEILDKPRPRIGFIPSGSDPDRRYFSDRAEYYASLGADLCQYCDLADEYDPAAAQGIFSCDAIHLTGGNTFQFLDSIRRRQFGDQLVSYAQRGGALIGVSAGAILMTGNIMTARCSGDVNDYGVADMTGLSLVAFDFIPHLSTYGVAEEVIRAHANAYPDRTVLGCDDGDGIIVNDRVIELFGSISVGSGDRCFKLAGTVA